MLPTDHRWIYYYDFDLKPYPEDAPPFKLEPVLRQVEQAWKKGEAVHQYENGALTVRIKDMKFVKDYVGVLINVSNINATDPAFSHVITGDVRTEQKKDNEGIAASCHILFRKDELKVDSHKYLALIEEVVGIPKSIIERFLTFLFRAHCKATYVNPAKNEKKPLQCRPKAVFQGHGSETLQSSLKEGELQGVVLLNHKDTGFIDDTKQLRTTERVMRLRATEKPKGNAALALIKRAREYADQNNFDEVRVQFKEVVEEIKTVDKQGKQKKKEIAKQRTVKFESREQDFANMIFTKSEMIKLDKTIGQCEELIHAELLNSMKKKLDNLMNK
tara:strand:+ start:542 stop:1534 length:993 start_codon:yes stop_codon:yes gene_type:complete